MRHGDRSLLLIGVLLSLVAVLLSGCITSPDGADGRSIRLTIDTAYQPTKESQGIDLPQGTSAAGLAMQVVLAPTEEPLGEWSFDPGCQRAATYAPPWSGCDIERKEAYVLPPPNAGEQAQYRNVVYPFSDNGTLQVVAPVPLNLTINLNWPYTSEMKDRMEEGSECERPHGVSAGFSTRVGADLTLPEYTLLDQDTSGTLFWTGDCFDDAPRSL